MTICFSDHFVWLAPAERVEWGQHAAEPRRAVRVGQCMTAVMYATMHAKIDVKLLVKL